MREFVGKMIDFQVKKNSDVWIDYALLASVDDLGFYVTKETDVAILVTFYPWDRLISASVGDKKPK